MKTSDFLTSLDSVLMNAKPPTSHRGIYLMIFGRSQTHTQLHRSLTPLVLMKGSHKAEQNASVVGRG